MEPSCPPQQPFSVIVRDLTKSYGNGNVVLNKLQMSVPSSSIYGLLGASGCGKTTLLSCILGLKRGNSGWIKVFGKSPRLGRSDVGYQPQEMALYNYLTVADTLTYFGRLLCMSESDIQVRIKSLSSSLNLPNGSKYIRNLSGGQQRRVSLAVTILRNRKLLILDEPTAGQDPLLIESIWNQLRNHVTSFSTTIIITSHYIEELKAAETVGFMRNGRLLAEEDPLNLLAQHNATLLEDVFLSLCRKEEAAGLEPVANRTSGLTFHLREEHFHQSRTASDHAMMVLALVTKTFLFLKATPWLPLGVILLPCLQLFIALLILGKDPKHIPMGVVNRDVTGNETSCSESLISEGTHCLSGHLSCQYLNKFPPDEFTWVLYESDQEALRGVHNGETIGYISFPYNYSAHFRDWIIYKKFSDNETIDGSTVYSRLDATLKIKSDLIQIRMFQYFASFLSTLVRNCGGEGAVSEMPLKFHAIYGTLNSTIQAYMLPGFIVLIILGLPTACALRFLQDRKQGTFQRSQVSGLQHWHTFLELVISEGLILALQVMLSSMILKFVGGYSGMTASSFLLIYLVGVVGISAGFLIGQAVDEELEVIYVILGFYMPLMYGSGGSQPFERMSFWARQVYLCSPTAQPIISLRSIVTRGWGITHSKVWPGFMVCFIYITVLFLLSATVIKYRIRQ